VNKSSLFRIGRVCTELEHPAFLLSAVRASAGASTISDWRGRAKTNSSPKSDTLCANMSDGRAI
jgi:hypothetical protein